MEDIPYKLKIRAGEALKFLNYLWLKTIYLRFNVDYVNVGGDNLLF